MSTPVWGWTSYERTGFVRDDGSKLYVGHFRRENDIYNWTVQTIRFWAKRPIVALRTIVNSGKDPSKFNSQDVN